MLQKVTLFSDILANLFIFRFLYFHKSQHHEKFMINLKSSLQTILVALPLSSAPVKVHSQSNIAKQAINVIENTGGKLNIRAGAGYGKTPVLYAPTTAYGDFGVRFDAATGKNSSFYQDLNIVTGKGGTNGRYEAGYQVVKPNGFSYNAGAFASNDFGSKEFLAVKNTSQSTNKCTPLQQGLLQAGVTGGVEQPIHKNLRLFAKGDIANVSYSYTGECVVPFESRIINGVEKRVLKEKFNYEKGVGRSLQGKVEAGLKAKAGKFDITGSAGYSSYQGTMANIKALCNFDLVKFGKYKK